MRCVCGAAGTKILYNKGLRGFWRSPVTDHSAEFDGFGNLAVGGGTALAGEGDGKVGPSGLFITTAHDLHIHLEPRAQQFACRKGIPLPGGGKAEDTFSFVGEKNASHGGVVPEPPRRCKRQASGQWTAGLPYVVLREDLV